MTLKPWEAQKLFGTATNEVKAPVTITVVSKSDSFQISWQKRLGMVDGFIILVGDSPNELRDYKRIQKSKKSEYSVKVISLVNGREYYTSVIAFRGDKRSDMTEVWKVTPNISRLQRQAEKIAAETIAANVQIQTEAPEVANTPEAVQDANVDIVVAESQSRQNENTVAICAGCAGDVILDMNLHLYVCSGCNTKYVQRVVDGKFVSTNILINGICECCEPRRPLVQPLGETYKKCSESGEKYIELPDNGLIRVSQLDYGLCSCCRPPAALVLNAQGQMICSTKRENLYVRQGDSFVLQVPEAPPSLLSDIDRALSNGSAGMMPNGILVSND